MPETSAGFNGPVTPSHELRLKVSAVAHGFLDSSDYTYNASGMCNVDVACSVGSPWVSSIHALH